MNLRKAPQGEDDDEKSFEEQEEKVDSELLCRIEKSLKELGEEIAQMRREKKLKNDLLSE